MNKESFINFVWDSFIKSFENRDSLLEATIFTSFKDKNRIINNIYSDLKFWENVYNNRFNYIKSNTYIKFKNSTYPVNKLSFHAKFGWTISNENYKAYLGKTSIFDSVVIEIGNRSYFSGHGTIRGKGLLQIGSFCSIAYGSYLNVSNENHSVKYPASIGLKYESRMQDDNYLQDFSFKYHKEDLNPLIIVGNDVWIGKDVSIQSGVKIGNGCVIGAKSMINRNCEPYGIYAGTPARLIRYRFSKEIIDQLMEIEWWNWSEKKMLRNEIFFNTDLTKASINLRDIVLQ